MNNTTNTNEQRENNLLTRKEAAARLGISLRHIDTQIAKGDLPCINIGRSVRLRPSTLELFVKSRETCRADDEEND